MKNWTILLPYYNEATFLPGTLESIALQNYQKFKLILINNHSTDNSEKIARKFMNFYPAIEVQFINEKLPGKTNALHTGLNHVTTPFVATMDADTYYPQHYLEFCNQIFESHPEYSAVMACDIYQPFKNRKSQKRCRKIYLKSKLMPKQCHAGGYAQTFRTKSLKQIGGFDQKLWPYVFEDHEVIHRLLKISKVYYSPKHWCIPSERRTKHKNIRWSRMEKFLYEYTPFFLKDWYFYSFLKNRYIKKNTSILQLRQREWE
ncbi:glycosyltransferase family 2 protein [Commensalibacter sp. M0357]|uniref:glycosyltransferase family 2 protein n=1 Tax=unclassified Commensalibacter TaxID=2630218 RepID=UPI0018DD240B|nr:MULTISPECIES: glycosyltransferase family A protein [unclassified Commensalibacter]MBI0075492.1 glycosyltransferase family 2 protein [Commensalibacter sp. M0357]MBI0085334.1 glycosyltransferase family 2 protein [Commensalibacter sp. M0355]